MTLAELNVQSFTTSSDAREVKAGLDPSVRSWCYQNSTCQACNEPTFWC